MKFEHIDTINFSFCDTIYKNKLYYDPTEDLYYKVWPEGEIVWERRIGDLFLQAINKGFYSNLAKIEFILVSDNNTCVGYAMKSYNCPKIMDGLSKFKNKHRFNVIKNASEQSEKYQHFYKILTENIEKTHFFFYDLVQSNISDLGDRYGIIDLESIAHIRDLRKIPRYHLECIPLDYRAFLEDLYSKEVGLWNSGIDMGLIKKAWSMSTGGMNFKSYYSITINGQYFDGERPWELRWKKFADVVRWDNLKILDLGTCMGVVPAFLLKYYESHSATAIDCNPHHIQATELVRKAFRIPEEKMTIIQIDLHKDEYEKILGYDYDVVFCLSFFRWIEEKERLFKYLTNFNTVIFEAHDLDGDIESMFKTAGYSVQYLGDSVIGKTFSDQSRPMYAFFRNL